MIRGKLLFFVTEDWVFCSHRLPLAIAAKEAGYEVVVVTRVREHGEQILSAGLKLIPFEMSRRGMNPIKELSVLFGLWKIYRQERPDIVHHVAIKPVLYGSLVAIFSGCKRVVNAVTGMGSMFISESKKAKVIKPFLIRAFRLLLNRGHSRLVLQNPDDVDLFTTKKMVSAKNIELIRGSGVNTQEFSPNDEPPGDPVVVLASRMLWDKGVGEFVESAKLLKQEGVNARFVLVGKNDPENPSSIPVEQLESWQHSGLIEWWGHKSAMAKVFAQSNIVCLPSYREGLPKVLLEAASCGLPIVATDVPGCREIVSNGENGFLVPLKDSVEMAEALRKLIESKDQRNEMGIIGRNMVEKHFSNEIVIDKFLKVYQGLLET